MIIMKYAIILILPFVTYIYAVKRMLTTMLVIGMSIGLECNMSAADFVRGLVWLQLDDKLGRLRALDVVVQGQVDHCVLLLHHVNAYAFCFITACHHAIHRC